MEAACAKAIAVGDPSYRTIKGILAAGTDIEPVTESSRTGDGGASAFLHGPSRLFANVIPVPTPTQPLAVNPSTTNDPDVFPMSTTTDTNAA